MTKNNKRAMFNEALYRWVRYFYAIHAGFNKDIRASCLRCGGKDTDTLLWVDQFFNRTPSTPSRLINPKYRTARPLGGKLE